EDEGERVRMLHEVYRAVVEAEVVAFELAQQADYSTVLSEFGEILARAGQWERAEKVICRAAERTENKYRVKMLSELGAAFARTKQWAKAKATWAQAEAIIHTIEEPLCKVKAFRDYGQAIAGIGKEGLMRAQAVWAEAEAILRTLGENEQKAR